MATNKINMSSIISKGILFNITIAAVIFISAGTLNYWQGWVFVGLTALTWLLNLIFMSIKNPELINERLKPGEGRKSWDKKIIAISTVIYFIMIILGPLDAKRFIFSEPLSFEWVIAGSLLLIIGQSLFLWAKITNQYFSSVVRIQKDRSHKVCQDGPYRIIRHPGYLGGFLWTVGTPLILASLYSIIPMIVSIVFLILRTYLEDRTLYNELEGYKDYSNKIKYRIVPLIW